MKKETLQTVAIIVLCLAMCFAGCKTASVDKKLKTMPSLIALIKYESGQVEYMKDSFSISKVGDTVITIHMVELMKDSVVVENEFIWGFPNAEGIIPTGVEQDSLYVEFNKVVVLHLVHVCVDPSHETCDGQCICDGMECSDQ